MFTPLYISSASLLLILTLSTPALAQPSAPVAQSQVKQVSEGEINSQEIEKFAKAIQEMRAIQIESRDKVNEALQNEGLSKERFREILKAQRNPQEDINLSQQEQEQFETVSEKLAQIQRETQSNMKEAVESKGLEVARFQQILAAVREQPTLRQEVQQIIQSESNE